MEDKVEVSPWEVRMVQKFDPFIISLTGRKVRDYPQAQLGREDIRQLLRVAVVRSCRSWISTGQGTVEDPPPTKYISTAIYNRLICCMRTNSSAYRRRQLAIEHETVERHVTPYGTTPKMVEALEAKRCLTIMSERIEGFDKLCDYHLNSSPKSGPQADTLRKERTNRYRTAKKSKALYKELTKEYQFVVTKSPRLPTT
jgi:hypothetical protein